MRTQRLRLVSKSISPSICSPKHVSHQPASTSRHFTTSPRYLKSSTSKSIPDFAFAFDIDGVLLRSSKPIPGATKRLKYLQSNNIPFILLTNGGGKHESERVKDLSSKLSVQIDTSMIVQSHTPYQELIYGEKNLKNKCILVLGGKENKCREIAETYGYTNVIIPGDIYSAYPEIWPLGKTFKNYYSNFTKPLPKPINVELPEKSLKIDAIFVYSDPPDWALDIQLLLDLILSKGGILGTYSSKNGDKSLINNGYLQDDQPILYFSNPDLLYAAGYHLPRLGQGGFRESFEGVWKAVTDGKADLYKNIIGKPYKETYEFAEKRLIKHRKSLYKDIIKDGQKDGQKDEKEEEDDDKTILKKVYMIGDNPESDIRGANSFKSTKGIEWISLLTRTGVYRDGSTVPLKWKPREIVDDVSAAVEYALKENNFS